MLGINLLFVDSPLMIRLNLTTLDVIKHVRAGHNLLACSSKHTRIIADKRQWQLLTAIYTIALYVFIGWLEHYNELLLDRSQSFATKYHQISGEVGRRESHQDMQQTCCDCGGRTLIRQYWHVRMSEY